MEKLSGSVSPTHAMATFNLIQLPVELVHRVALHCDLLSLLALRITCKSLRVEVTTLLQAEKKALLAFYVSLPDNLWQHLEGACTVVGGLAALSFVLRSPELRPPSLDVFIASDQEQFLEQWLEQDTALQLQDGTTEVWDLHDGDEMRLHVAQMRTYVCQNGRSISIHTSRSLSPLDPIAASVTTALCNWVSPVVFACGYPALTFKLRSVGRDVFRRNTSIGMLYAHLVSSGFEIQSDPSAWEDYNALVPESTSDYHQSCMRSLYLCPNQARFFGDPGSIVAVVDSEATDHVVLRGSHQPPYGITIRFFR
ncbi:hypothetical protein VTO73DRAFT_4853 [Trametes versicolor]